ncbi:MAG: hypothetical protein ACI4JD_04445 [Ruminococcus sp.]
MSKYFKPFIITWSVLLVLFNVIAFASAGWIFFEKYTPSFWIGYAGVMLAFIGNFFCTYTVLKENSAKKFFYNLPIISLAYSGLIASFLAGGLCMLISPLPYYAAAIACAVILAVYIIAVVNAKTASGKLQAIDKETEIKTQFIRAITAEAENLKAKAESAEAKANVQKVYEALRYSDPMSSDALYEIEMEMQSAFEKFADAVKSGNDGYAEAKCLIKLTAERNSKCKTLK